MEEARTSARGDGGLPLGVRTQQVPLPFGPDEAPLALGSLPSLAAALAEIPEHRRPRGYRADEPPYPLVPLLLLLLLGVLCGRRGYGSIAAWAESVGQAEPALLATIGCPRDRKRVTPSPVTFFRCIRDLNRAAFQQAVHGWLRRVAAALGPVAPELRALADQLSLDGKTVRGATARQGGEAGVHLVAAYAPALQLIVDQVETAGKGHELAAVEALLGRLPLKGKVITGDALLTQRTICTTILEGGGDYLFPVKENQPTLLSDLATTFSPGGPGDADPGGAGRPPAGHHRPAALASRGGGGHAGAGGPTGPEAAARAAGGAGVMDDSVPPDLSVSRVGRDGGRRLARRPAGRSAPTARPDASTRWDVGGDE